MDRENSGSGLKREFNDDGENGNASKRSRGSGPHADLRILLPSKTAGAIIGKGGANIKRLRQDYNATVIVPDTDGPERVLNISTDLGSACEVVVEIINGIEADRGGVVGGEAVVRYLIHQSQAGAVIGKAGYRIKELREASGAQIKVFSECCPLSTDRIVEIGGTPDVISKTTFNIFEFLQTAPPKGVNQQYDPNNFDESFSGEYGGYTFSDAGFGGNSRGGRGGGRGGGGRGGPRGGMGLRGAPRGAGNFGGFGRGGFGNAGFGAGGGAMGGFGRGGMGGGGFGGMPRGAPRGAPRGGGAAFGASNLMDGSYQQASAMSSYIDQSAGDQSAMYGAQATDFTQVSIPKDMAGAIIGKGGMRITQIRNDSGATITIDEPLPGSNERIINIAGTSDQIQNAQYLLQMSVKQYSGGPAQY